LSEVNSWDLEEVWKAFHTIEMETDYSNAYAMYFEQKMKENMEK
jgi:hypothetical protein